VGQLLEFAKPVPVSPKLTSLQGLVDDSVRLIEQKAKEKQITVNTLNSTKVDRAVIDPDRINQVLLNLYLNAVESMEPAGELAVELAVGEEGQYIEIKVSDTGCGIPGEHVPRIFDPYFTTKSTGTGLGLAIAHNTVKAMGGKINISSRPGKGTTFWIIIPTSEDS
jgi:two-component system sensor histidine kinase HydH